MSFTLRRLLSKNVSILSSLLSVFDKRTYVRQTTATKCRRKANCNTYKCRCETCGVAGLQLTPPKAFSPAYRHLYSVYDRYNKHSNEKQPPAEKGDKTVAFPNIIYKLYRFNYNKKN